MPSDCVVIRSATERDGFETDDLVHAQDGSRDRVLQRLKKKGASIGANALAIQDDSGMCVDCSGSVVEIRADFIKCTSVGKDLPARVLGTTHHRTPSGSEEKMRNARLRQLREIRDLKDSPTVREFLGGNAKQVSVTNVVGASPDTVAAQKLVDDFMDSLLLQSHSDGPSPGQAWSEMAVAMITAVIKFDDGRVGLLEIDRRGYLFMEDHDGIGWWYQWDPQYPRISRSRLTP